MDSPRQLSRQMEYATIGCLIIALFIGLTAWDVSPPRTGSYRFFWLGVVALLVFSGLFALAGWHLLVWPLPERCYRPPQIPLVFRRFLAFALGLSGLCVNVGVLWDETWHRQFGLRFGEDFHCIS